MRLSQLIIELQKRQAELSGDPEVGFWAPKDMDRPLRVKGFWPDVRSTGDTPSVILLSPYERDR